jgi:hypothetical protein
MHIALKVNQVLTEVVWRPDDENTLPGQNAQRIFEIEILRNQAPASE